MEKVTGYSAEEIANMHPADFFDAKEKNYIAERIQAMFQKGINDADANLLTREGKKIPYFFKTVVIDYEGSPCLLGNGIDITERKRAETELRASEQKYKLLFESNPLPMWMLSLPDYKFIDVNNCRIVAIWIYKRRISESFRHGPASRRRNRKVQSIHKHGFSRRSSCRHLAP